ncbi:MAG: response regulator [Verrucomicrobiota bacterium]
MSASAATGPAILLVDDNPHDVVLLRLAFRRVGIIDPIKLVKDGADAVRYLKGEGVFADRHAFPAPTLMLLDLNMPQTSGFEVLRWVREQPAFRTLAVIVMSGSKETADVQRAYGLGADSYLVKPTRFSDLLKITQSLKSYYAMTEEGASKLRGSPLGSLGLADSALNPVPTMGGVTLR